jgi:hypothetical protein
MVAGAQAMAAAADRQVEAATDGGRLTDFPPPGPGRWTMLVS